MDVHTKPFPVMGALVRRNHVNTMETDSELFTTVCILAVTPSWQIAKFYKIMTCDQRLAGFQMGTADVLEGA